MTRNTGKEKMKRNKEFPYTKSRPTQCIFCSRRLNKMGRPNDSGMCAKCKNSPKSKRDEEDGN